MGRDDLLRHGSLLSLATVSGAGAALVFNVFMARALGPETFGVMGALLAIFAIVSQFGNALQLTVARSTSRAIAEGDTMQVSSLLMSSLRLMLVIAVGVSIGLMLLTPVLSDFLRVPSRLTLIFLAVSTSLYLMLPVLRGSLQGLQKFVSLSINRMGEKIVLLLAGVSLVVTGMGINGVMIALGIAGTAMIILASVSLRSFFKWSVTTMDWRSLVKPGVPVLLTVVLISIVANMDLVLAKHFLEDRDAGLYSAIARTGRIVFFISLAFSRAMFPKAAEAHALGRSPKFLMARSVAYIGTFCLAAVVAAAFIAKPAIGLVYGQEYVEVAFLLPWYIGAVSLLSISTVLMYYNLSISSYWHLIPLTVCVGLMLTLISLFHGSHLAIVVDLTVSLAFLTVVNLAVQMLKSNGLSQKDIQRAEAHSTPETSF